MDRSGEVWERASFLAAPGRVADWRMALLYDTAAAAGIIDELPATPSEVAERRGLDARAVRVLLEALATWHVVAADGGHFSLGARAPAPEEGAVVRHHARSVRLWAERLPDRIGPGPAEDTRPSPGPDLGLWLEALAVNARESAPGAVEECVRRLPAAHTVLDLGGGHGEYALEFARRGLDVTMQDRPAVVELARGAGRLEGAGIRLYSGDFFETVASGPFDMVFCAGVTYTYDASRNRDLFRRVRGVITAGGTLALHTFLRGRDPRAAIFAVQMVAASGGDTHGEDDYRRWLAEAGYGQVDVVDLQRPPESMVFAAT